MRIVYIILAHKNPRQVIRLVNALNAEKNLFFIHIDKKSGDEVHEIVSEFSSQLNNVYLLNNQKLYWGRFSIVEATIKIIDHILRENVEFDYLKLLSGQDYPIKSNAIINEVLASNKNKSFIEFSPIPSGKWMGLGEIDGGMSRIQNWHVYLSKNQLYPMKLPKIKRNFPKGFQPFIGSQFWCLSRDCAEYVSTFTKDNSKFIDFFRHVNIPDEVFFQTIVLNSHFKEQVVNSDLTYIDWTAKLANPKILRQEDLENLSQFSGLFARKFDSIEDSNILDLIDDKLLVK
jgi:Core-2/I-Branching enzyme